MLTPREIFLISSPRFKTFMELQQGRTLLQIEVKLYYILWKMELQDRLGKLYSEESFLDFVSRQ
jgi:hypothetical protein